LADVGESGGMVGCKQVYQSMGREIRGCRVPNAADQGGNVRWKTQGAVSRGEETHTGNTVGVEHRK
jgi:hypothetical protein